MEWIDINDRKPPQDTYVLISKFDNRPKTKMHFVQIASRFGNRWVDDKNGDIINPKYGFVTHWMPLPEPPKDNTT